MRASVGSKAWGVWGAVVVVLLSVSPANAQGGTFTDKRDGKTYRTVVIGKQRWMAENLNFKTERSVCYENADSNCTKYGRLYDWDDAMTACPAGWKLPSYAEWDSLALVAGGKRYGRGDWAGAGKNLKSKTGWNYNDEDSISGNGTDDIGFSALPGGGRSPKDACHFAGQFSDIGNTGNWWSATEDYGMPTLAKCRAIAYNREDMYRSECHKKYLSSVRCIREE